MSRTTPLPIALAFALAGATVVAGCGLGDPLTRGARALDNHDYEAARTAYDEAIRRDLSPIIAYANRCIANGALDRTDEAIADCTEALDRAERDGAPEGFRRAEVLNNRAVAHIRKRDEKAAIADLDEALALEPEYAEAYANRGRAHIELEEYDAALTDLDRAIELNDGLSEVYGNRAFAQQNLGHLDEAYADYAHAIAIDDNPAAYFNRAMLRYTYGDFDGAYEDFVAVGRHERPEEPNYFYFIAEQQAAFLENRPSAATRTAAAAGSAEGTPVVPAADVTATADDGSN